MVAKPSKDFMNTTLGTTHSKNVLTVVNKLDSTSGDEVRATGTWSDTFEEAGTIHANGNYAWVLVHEGDTWRIRKSIFDITIHRQ